MTVRELIKDLQKCNQDAKVLHTIGNVDDDMYCSSEFSVVGINEPTMEYVELYQDIDEASQQCNNPISCLDHYEITIELEE